MTNFGYDTPLNMHSTQWLNSYMYNFGQWQANASRPNQSGFLQIGNIYPNYSIGVIPRCTNRVKFNWNNTYDFTGQIGNLSYLPRYNYNQARSNYSTNIYSGKNLFTGSVGVLTNSSIFTNGYSEQKPSTSFLNISNNVKSNNNQVTIQEDLRSEFLTTASKYMGCNESDGSWRKISNSKEWCADFITHVVNETYNDNGYADLKGFTKKAESPHMRVEEIKQWGIDNDKYLDLSQTADEATKIKRNVQKGDIMILRENGASHTGFVKQVYQDGSFLTVEGNRNDEVTTHRYSADDERLSGFVQLA